MTSYHKPPLYIGIFDHLIIFDMFSLLTKLDDCSHVKEATKHTSNCLSSNPRERQKMSVPSTCTLSKLYMRVTWSAPP